MRLERIGEKEFLTFSKIDNRDILVSDHPGPKRTHKFKEFVTDPSTQMLSKGRVVITNYEALQMKTFVKALEEWRPDMLICDESHRCKSHEGVRAKTLAALADLIKYKLILTGTPILNTSMDIFQQFRILDNGETFGKNFWAFRSTWFEDQNASWSSRPNHFPKYEPRPSTYKDFNRLIYKKAMRVLKQDCLDLPPLVKEEAYVEMSLEQEKLYSSMRDEYIAFIESELKTDKPRAVVAQLAITKSLRLQQIVSGFAKTEEGEIYEIKENPRLTVLKDYLEQITKAHKVIVWATFHENYKRIAEVCRTLGVNFAQYHGLLPQREREENLESFRRAPDTRVLIANARAGGEGINLTEASYSIFYSRNFSLAADTQAEARNYRAGSNQHEKVTRIDLIAKGTIDELISEVLAQKLNAANTILDMTYKL